jgi:Mg-chelatase subunit ChlI
VTTTPPAIKHHGQLRASGHEQKSLREELRSNLLDALREGRDPLPGLHGFDSTVIPQLERALLAASPARVPAAQPGEHHLPRLGAGGQLPVVAADLG